MAKLITIYTKSNAVLVGNGHFPLPLQRIGPNTWRNIRSPNYGVSPIDGSQLVMPTFSEVAELAGFALADCYKHGTDGKSNFVFNPAIDVVNKYVLAGNSIWVISLDRVYFIDTPSEELVAQFGVNDQNTLDRLVAGFEEGLEGRKERKGIIYGNNIASVSIANVSQGAQSRNPRDDNYFGKNIGLIAATSKKVAESLAIGSKACSREPYFGLSADATKIITRVPGLGSGGFDRGLDVDGWRVVDVMCSFGYSKSGEATRG